MSKARNAKYLKKTGVAGFVALTLGAGLVGPAYSQQVLEEVIVTARKTQESLQDVPISVTVHTGDSLKDAGITEFVQVASQTPNFDVRSDNVRGELAAELTIRGQSSTTSDLTIDQAVGININGAPVTRGTNLFGNLFDIEQIEVLKGPQGTLFGKNTTGGLVIVTTTAPQLGENSGYVEATAGNFSQFDVEAVGNVALGETAALRFGAAVTSRDGFGQGVFSDGSDSGFDLGDDDEEFFRASFLYKPSEDFSLRINVDTHDVDENGAVIRALLPGAIVPGVIFAALPPATDEFFAGANFNDGQILPNSDEPEVTADETNINATIEANLGFAKLTSITSYRDQDSNTNLNFSPLGAIEIGQNSELIAQELRFSGGAEAFTWQAGLFLSNEEGDDRNNTVGRAQVTAVENDSVSIFGQFGFDLSDKLSLTVGARYTEDDRAVELIELGALAAFGGSVAAARVGLGTTALDDGTVILNDGTTIENDAEFEEFSWTVALDYKLTEDQLVYGSISRGFRSGGIDGDGLLSTEVDPEFVDNIEFGYKASFLNQSLRWNSAIWYSDYTDIQIQSFSLDTTVTAGVPLAVLNNAAEAELFGFESEIEWLPTNNFTLKAAVGYTDGEFSEFTEPRLIDPANPAAGTFEFDRSDEDIAGPELQFNLTARYSFDVAANTRGAFQLSYTFLDEQILGSPAVIDLVNGQAASLQASGVNVGQESNFGVIEEIDLVNATLDFQIGESLNVALWSKNLTDEEFFSTGFALEVFGGLAQRTVGSPRQYGVTVRYDF